ncbi:hypothetical protein A7A78_11010 [Aequorivita soesokkakensis]|uniref:Uncharacterized protein n=1 Tax=Aequorivita soesokkakensis TaxID=1385699 RepID=A0A1A9LH17_9FLAO|nr:hypothetical protein [Aequorivita soesokkakensis]OAD91775.1 hypothetical protein A7A78_11010 [Aequorivita soesokkakensis]
MKYFLFILAFVVYSPSFSQDNSEINYIFQKIESIQKDWKYFKLKDTIQVKIIQHNPALFLCGITASASMTIVQMENGKLIRVLDLCNLSDEYEVNQMIKILPFQNPDIHVSLPFDFRKNSNNKYESMTQNYDTSILDTTWGILIK